jgi:hypothetical protein
MIKQAKSLKLSTNPGAGIAMRWYLGRAVVLSHLMQPFD